MSCPACEKRQAQEARQLSDCESKCREMSKKNQRLTLALTVMATLLGKESLDLALGLSSSLDAFTSEASQLGPDTELAAVTAPDQEARSWNSSGSSLIELPLFPYLPALTPELGKSFFPNPSQDQDIWSGETYSFVPQSSGLALMFLAFGFGSRKRCS